jgi:hypothetical protein
LPADHGGWAECQAHERRQALVVLYSAVGPSRCTPGNRI